MTPSCMRRKKYDLCKQVLKMRSPKDRPSFDADWEPSVLRKASETGDVETVQKLLESNSSIQKLVSQDRWQRTALMEASSRGHVEIVKLLLAANSTNKHVLTRDHDEKTALIEASAKGRVDVVKLLLAANSRDEHIMAQDGWRSTALCKASVKGHVDVVKALLDVNSSEEHLLIQDCSEATALFAASAEGHVEIVRLLLAANASIKHVRSCRKTQPHLWWQPIDRTKRFPRQFKESTSMAAASSAGHIDIMRLLVAERRKNNIELFADLSECLSFACFYDQKRVIQYLLAFETPNIVGISLRGKLGGIALLEVINRGSTALARTLLQTPIGRRRT